MYTYKYKINIKYKDDMMENKNVDFNVILGSS